MKITYILLTAALVSFNTVNAASITNLQITGGNFLFGGQNLILNPASFANMNMDGINYIGSEPTTPGTEQSYFSTSIATSFGSVFGPLSFYTSDIFSLGIPAPSGNINQTTQELTLDLSSWTFFFSELGGLSHNIGSTSNGIGNIDAFGCHSIVCSTPIITTYNSLTGGFTASWDTYIDHGVIPGVTTSTFLTGTVSTVPVPSAIWLFASGLFCLLGVMRNKNSNC